VAELISNIKGSQSDDPILGQPGRKLSKAGKNGHLQSKLVQARNHWGLYVLLLPAMVYYILFHYVPLYGIQLGFKDYSFMRGIWGSSWVGLQHFEQFFASWAASKIIVNTLLLSFYSMIIGIPSHIVFALMLNWITSVKYKRTVQTVTYAPHFISMVVLVGIMATILSPTKGVVNALIVKLGGEPVYFFGEAGIFRHLFVWSGVWQNIGWGTIIFLAALSNVNPELYEAAKIDGATKPQLIWHIDLPTILPTIAIVTILALGRTMTVNFEKAYLMQTGMNLETSEVIQTYVYKRGIVGLQISYATAVGLFNSVVNAFMLITFNYLARRLKVSSIW